MKKIMTIEYMKLFLFFEFVWCQLLIPDRDTRFKWDVISLKKSYNNYYDLFHNDTVLFASELLDGQPVYISLTSISHRISHVPDTVRSLLLGAVLPSRIFIFLSEEPYMLDKGVDPMFLKTNDNWTSVLSNPLVSVVFTNNIGPHRKLLPLLHRKWNEDCIIVTVDDDEIYPHSALLDLISYYKISGKESVVALRARRMGLCADAPPWRLAPYPRKGRWPVPSGGRQEMLMLPTGIGGVLYHPKFFHPFIFDEHLRELTRTGDDLMFRLGTMANNRTVVAGCSPGKYDCPKVPRILFASSNTLGTPNNTSDRRFRGTDESSPVGSHRDRRAGESRHARRPGPIARRIAVTPSGDKATMAATRVHGEGSLANHVNNNGGNDAMWRDAVQYLAHKGVFDFQQMLQEYAPKERGSCLLQAFRPRERNRSKSSMLLNSMLEVLHSSVQNLYDRRCGVQYCV